MEPEAEERVRRLMNESEQLLQSMNGARADPKKDERYHDEVIAAVMANNKLREQLEERDRQLRQWRYCLGPITVLAYAALLFLVVAALLRIHAASRLAWAHWTEPGPRYGLAPDAVSAPALSAECRPFDPHALGNDSRRLYAEVRHSVLKHLESRPTFDFLCAQHLGYGVCYCAMRLRSISPPTILELGYGKINITCKSPYERVLSRFRSQYCLSVPIIPNADNARTVRRYRHICMRYHNSVDGRVYEYRLEDIDAITAQAIADTQRGKDPCSADLNVDY
jgi:hypothetical protein